MKPVESEYSETEAVTDEEEKERRPIAEPLFAKIDSFDEANLSPSLQEAIGALGWKVPTPVQGLCLPFSLQGRDVAGFAQTGTGKTGVFLVTLAHRLQSISKRELVKDGVCYPFGVVLVPTRELAMQINEDAAQLFSKIGLSSMAVFGGIDYEKQALNLKNGVDVIVATPGRLKDFYQKNLVSLQHTQTFVCDEADRMFDMGFIEDVEFFLGKLGERTQRLLFSATTNDQVKELAFEYLEAPEYISVNPEVITPDRIDQRTIIVEAKHKLKVMIGLLREQNPHRAIVFTNTKLVADWLHYKLVGNGFSADVLTGDLPQKKRIQLIQKIKAGELKILIATDVASRGLHISEVSHVFNFDLPDDPSNYVHRIGRTARAGANGISYSLVCEDYGQNLAAIKDLLGTSIELRSEWFPISFLEINDQAGNPYEDPEFRNNTLVREDKSWDRSGGRDRDRGHPRARQREDRASFRDRAKSDGVRDGQKKRVSKSSSGPSKEQWQKAKGHEKQDGRRSAKKDFIHKEVHSSKDSRHSERRGRFDLKEQERAGHKKRRDSLAVEAAASSQAPMTLAGLIKRFFAALFGRKPKN